MALQCNDCMKQEKSLHLTRLFLTDTGKTVQMKKRKSAPAVLLCTYQHITRGKVDECCLNNCTCNFRICFFNSRLVYTGT